MSGGVCDLPGERCYHPISCEERGCVKQRPAPKPAPVTTPPARTYAQGVEDAAKVAENLCADMTVEANAETASLTSTLHRASAQTAGKIAAAIRLLSQGEKA